MKKSISILIISMLSIFSMSCDPETIAALTEAASGLLEQTAGCMNEDNSNFNPGAKLHVADSCATQIYGCTDVSALNYVVTATNMCAGISEDLCCTSSTVGCTDPNYENYDDTANEDDGSCSGTITFGCMTSSACNYNPFATSDCSKVAGGTNTNCCTSGSTIATECVQDYDNDGYQDAGTTSQTLELNNCGCGSIGYGWTDIEDTNGEVIYGCMDPWCPEFATQCTSTEGCANRDDGNCCLNLSVLDSLYMYGEDYVECATDPTLCVETTEFSLLGGYIADFSGCEDQMMGSEDFHDELYIYLGWDGEYYEEFLSIHEISGYRAEPQNWGGEAYDSPAECQAKAGSNSFWYCGNQVANTEDYRPCQEEYFNTPCEYRDECWWESPECVWKPQDAWVGESCFTDLSMSDESACTSNSGCQWNQQWGDCYFDCWGLSETDCAQPVLNEECEWKLPDSDSSGGYCLAPATTQQQCYAIGAGAGQCFVNGIVQPAYITPEQCQNAGQCSDPTFPTIETCGVNGMSWWIPFHEVGISVYWESGMSECNWNYDWLWDEASSSYKDGCECWVPEHSSTGEADCSAKCEGCEWNLYGGGTGQCEWKQYEDECSGYTTPDTCWDSTSANCEWDGGWCYKIQGAECWQYSMQNETSCTANSDCEWRNPPGYEVGTDGNISIHGTTIPSEFQSSVAQNPGVCNFYDSCNDWYCWDSDSGRQCDQQGCEEDNYCRWDDMPGQLPQCIEDQQAQYCDCFIEWNQADCNDNSGATWDPIHDECLWDISEDACYSLDDIMLGPEDGNIDCSEFVAENIDQYTEWNGEEGGFCEVIFEDVLDGVWSLDGDTICIGTEGDFEEEDCDLFDFEECQCNLHRCSWMPQPTYDYPDAGTCAEGSMEPGGSGGSRVQGVEHYAMKTVSPVFQDEMINYLFGGNPPEDCMSFSLQNNGDVHVTATKPNGQPCTVVFHPED